MFYVKTFLYKKFPVLPHNCKNNKHLVFTAFRRVSICLFDRPVRFGFLRQDMLQGSFKYA